MLFIFILGLFLKVKVHNRFFFGGGGRGLLNSNYIFDIPDIFWVNSGG